jgi:DNA-binding NtrC family response regulator
MKIIIVDDEPDHRGYSGQHPEWRRPRRHCCIEWAVCHMQWFAMWIMPGMNGIETAKEILQVLPDCRVILFSGQAASHELLSRAEAEGHTFELLAKPINPTLLLEKLISPPQKASRLTSI